MRANSSPISAEELVRVSLQILATHGLADVSMRRVAAEVGVRPSALYWHVANKQALLALVADHLLAQIRLPEPTGSQIDDVKARALAFYRGLMQTRDAAELVSSVIALGSGGAALRAGIAEVSESEVLTDTVVSVLLGHAVIAQQRAQARELGIIDSDEELAATPATSFEQMLDVVLNPPRNQGK